MSAEEETTTTPVDDTKQAGTFARCPRCHMEVRRSELEIHLAHAHNIGPPTAKKKKDKGRSGDRRRYDDE